MSTNFSIAELNGADQLTPKLREAAKEAAGLLDVYHDPRKPNHGTQARFLQLLKEHPQLATIRFTFYQKNVGEFQMSLLHLAAKYNHDYAIDPLIAAGADLKDVSEKFGADMLWKPHKNAVGLASDGLCRDVLLHLLKLGYPPGFLANSWIDLVMHAATHYGTQDALMVYDEAIRNHCGKYPEYVLEKTIHENAFELFDVLCRRPDFVKAVKESGILLKAAAFKDSKNHDARPRDGDGFERTPLCPKDERTGAPIYWMERLLKVGANPDSNTLTDSAGDNVYMLAGDLGMRDLGWLKIAMKYGADMMRPTAFRGESSYSRLRPMSNTDLFRMVDAHKQEAEAVWEQLSSGVIAVTDMACEQLYDCCTIGKGSAVFELPGWKNAQAADYGIKLIDSLIPSQQEQFAFDRAKLSRFAVQVTAPAHQGKVGDGQSVGCDVSARK